MNRRCDLVLLTANYPFGQRNEPFLEAELEVLASRFRRIYVVPSHREPGVRPLPSGVELITMPWLTPPGRAAKLRTLTSREAWWALSVTAGVPHDRAGLVRRGRVHADLLARNILKFRCLRSFTAARGLSEAIFYDYWFENSTLALALLRRSGQIRTAVARAHGFDLYEDGDRQVPFRTAKARGLDRVFPVSEHGARYLAARMPGLTEKISAQRLGVRDPERASPPPGPGVPLVVTCAFLRPDKRIHLVPEVLLSVPGPLRWVHFGDGPERERVSAAASGLPARIQWSLQGHVPGDEIMRFYEQNPVSALLSVSASEGLPVSMMEAQSYGIPIVACDAGGVPEIVNGTTGLLLGSAAPPAEIAATLAVALEPGRFERAVIRSHFQRRFSATVNYNRLADALIALHSGQAAGDRRGTGAEVAAEPDRPGGVRAGNGVRDRLQALWPGSGG
jgi:glycosyltransferase involved in cell wall biosynthesis